VGFCSGGERLRSTPSTAGYGSGKWGREWKISRREENSFLHNLTGFLLKAGQDNRLSLGMVTGRQILRVESSPCNESAGFLLSLDVIRPAQMGLQERSEALGWAKQSLSTLVGWVARTKVIPRKNGL
jgi:hypothetical protein